jgi:protein SCO1/2
MRLRLQTLRLRTLLAALILTSSSTVGLVGCADKPAAFNSMDVTGAPWGQTFDLPDLDGQPKTPASFPGKVSLVFFGFLYCPDACPAHLTKMMALKERLGPDADKLQLVFITVDPERDQPEALRKFLASFDPRIVGLRGSVEQVQAVAKDFRVFFKKVDTSASKSDPMAYTIDHTTFTYVYDPKGALRLVVPHDITLEKLEADVRALLK